LLAITAIAAWRFGILLPQRLLNPDWGSLFFAGCFGVVVGTLMFRFLQLGVRSRQYFRLSRDSAVWESEAHFVGGDWLRVTVGDNHGEAFDLGAHSQRVLCVTLCLLVGLASLDARALGLVRRFRQGVTGVSSSYCPELEVEPPKDDPNAPGCELIKRAYALGYSKDLGECAVTRTRAAAAAVCTLRQRDEPFAHYAWRLLSGFWARLRSYTGPEYFRGLRRDFGARVARLDTIRGAQRQVLSSAPHASHHVFTNLPDPGTGAFREESCVDRYRFVPHRPDPRPRPGRASQVFEQVLAQLLFETRYEPPAGYCREYVVHWGAPEDACHRLAENPEAFLRGSGALSQVRAVLDRWRLGRELEGLGKGSSQRALEPSQFVSFQCYVERPGVAAPERFSGPFKLDDQQFVAEELKLAPSPADAALYLDRYDAVASLLVRGFHYGALLSEAGIEPGVAEGLEPSFSAKDFLLTRLYGLENVDIFLEPGWISAREDLLEIYPYQLHLKNYVRVFRSQYTRERGRL
jgi:hypothetical protein